MFEKLKQDVEIIERELRKFQRTFHFVLHDYDYHHQNDEEEVIAKYNRKLDKIEQSCNEIKSESDKFIGLLEQAKERTTFYDKAIREIANKHGIDINHILDADGTRKDLLNPPANDALNNDCKTPT